MLLLFAGNMSYGQASGRCIALKEYLLELEEILYLKCMSYDSLVQYQWFWCQGLQYLSE